MPRKRITNTRAKKPPTPRTKPRSILLIGAGHMGGAFARGLVAEGLGAQLAIVDPALSPIDARRYRSADVLAVKDADALGRVRPRAIIFAVKPQVMAATVAAYAGLAKASLAVSIAAGTTVDQIRDWLGHDAVVRAMPNTPAAIGKGIAALYASAGVTPAQRKLAERLLRALGDIVWLDREELLDPVTALSGSGPAYVFFLVEALAKAGESVGLAPEIAMQLARKTVEGAGALLAARDASAEELRRAVTSPGGTTEAALRVLMSERGLEPLLRAAVEAGTARGRELGKRS